MPTITCFRQPTFTETVESKEGSVIHAVVFHTEAKRKVSGVNVIIRVGGKTRGDL